MRRTLSLKLNRPIRNASIVSFAIVGQCLVTARLADAQSAAPAAPNRSVPAKGAESQPAPAGSDSESQIRTIDDAIKLAHERRALLDGVHDYTATFSKTELVGKKVIKQTMDMKCRHKPFSVYLHCRAGKEDGREVLYVTGAHEGHLLVHERGLLASLAGTQSLKLDDPLVMDENRYPITDIGIAKIVDKSIAIWEGERKADPGNVAVRFLSNAKVGAVPCDEIEVVRKHQQPEFQFSLTRVFFAKESKLPIRAEQYGWPAKPGDKAPIVEEYNYADLHVNVGLTDADFDSRNPMYGFERSSTK